MSESIRFTVPGEPVAKQRPKVTRVNGFARAYTPKETVNYEALVRLTAQSASCPHFDGPVRVTILAYFEYPRSSWRKKNPLPAAPKWDGKDADNIAKSVCDGLNGTAWNDDRQVAALTVEKWFAGQGEPARCEIQIDRLTQGT